MKLSVFVVSTSLAISRPRNPLYIATLAAIALLYSTNAQAAEPGFRAGAAVSNITPPLGLDIIGGFNPQPSEHIHDELYARCIVLDDGTKKLALVICDLLGVHRLVSDEAR